MIVTVYRTSDGQEFDNLQDANEHQEQVDIKSGKALEYKLQKYKESYGYQALMRKHNLYEVGLWEVLGEDPNCDLGGPHHSPFLGRVDGRLDKVIEWAVMQPNFWQWGGGGRIAKTVDDVIKV